MPPEAAPEPVPSPNPTRPGVGDQPLPTTDVSVAPANLPTDMWFDAAAYKGAFEPNAETWLSGWSFLDTRGFIADSFIAIDGCTDPGACNFDPTATNDDGSCEFLSCAGCTDATACNFDASATIDDGSCEFISCAGCTDETACNYDASATIEDGSCCFENCVTFEMNDTFGDGWNFAIYEVFDAATNTLVASGDLDNAQSGDGLSIGTDILCLADGCYYLNVTEGDFATEISWILSGINGGIEIGGAPTTELFFSVGAGDCVVGCDNPLACNFDAATVISDCTLCEFDSCQGCTYEVATNYDATATIDDGSCDIVPVDDCPGDFNDDNVINAGDLLSFLGAFGTTCE
ncbi:MAG: hypothetical protein HRT74_03005 [Flavobacteriales bacterium]|nr:hypothetical protein [Flavobacteriales bacterium]